MNTRILLDIDGVIANFYKGFATFLNEKHGCTLDPDTDPANYPFDTWGGGVDKIDFNSASRDWIAQGGFAKLPAYDGAKDFVEKLMGAGNVFIVTARVGDWTQKFSVDIEDTIKKNTYEWLKKLGIPTEKVFFTHEKIQFCQEHDIGILIEDKMSTALEASKNGLHTILANRGYNGSQIDRFKIYRVYNFDEALAQVRKLQENG